MAERLRWRLWYPRYLSAGVLCRTTASSKSASPRALDSGRQRGMEGTIEGHEAMHMIRKGQVQWLDPPFPPPSEIAPRFPHSHSFDDDSYIKERPKPPPLRINNLGWAKLNRRNGPTTLAKRKSVTVRRFARPAILSPSIISTAGTRSRSFSARARISSELMRSILNAGISSYLAKIRRCKVSCRPLMTNFIDS